MILIAILFCLGVQHFANVGGWFQVSWFELYLKKLSPWLSKVDKRLAILLVIVPVLIIFLLLQFMFMWRFHGFFNLILSIAVLFLCVDARNLKTRLKEYFYNIGKKDAHGASVAVEGFIEEVVTEDIPTLSRAVTKAIILKSFEQVFANLFWFMIFGVYGVSTYFLIILLRQHAIKVNPGYIEISKLAEKIQEVMEWVPARLLGFTYALVGYFNKGFNHCMKHALSGLADTRKFILESGFASLDVDVNNSQADQTENINAIDLIERSMLVWLTALALILVGMWL